MNEFKDKTDNELVVITLQDEENFMYIMERYESKLLRYVKRFTGVTNECAEDIIQESFFKIYRNLNDFDNKLKFSSWAYRITHNEAINYIRKHKNKSDKNVSIDAGNDDTTSLLEILASDINIQIEAESKELQEKVRQILKKLKKKYQEVLILKYLEDKDYTEISDILKKPMGTVATLMNRAKKQFAELAQKENILKYIDHE
ncbi:RNA polymerase sigma factor [Patescibacteria group bacterium]|nr:RNA polymerase sigma factor [Patescibacteria group bacterium]